MIAAHMLASDPDSSIDPKVGLIKTRGVIDLKILHLNLIILGLKTKEIEQCQSNREIIVWVECQRLRY